MGIGKEQAHVLEGWLWGLNEATQKASDTWQTWVNSYFLFSLWPEKWLLISWWTQTWGVASHNGTPATRPPPFRWRSVTWRKCPQGLALRSFIVHKAYFTWSSHHLEGSLILLFDNSEPSRLNQLPLSRRGPSATETEWEPRPGEELIIKRLRPVPSCAEHFTRFVIFNPHTQPMSQWCEEKKTQIE